jgi:hypothetical protein
MAMSVAELAPPLPAEPGVPAALIAMPVWSDAVVKSAGLPIEDVPLVSIGGGLASFVLVDFARICGVPAEEIRVVSPQRLPYETLRDLMSRSQILDSDPLRSDSMSRVDNIWGFPSYAITRAVRGRTVRPLWQVLSEPIGAEFFNPSPREVFGGVDREADRIAWASMLVPGRATLIRRRLGGGYLCVVRPADGGVPFALRCRFIHLATGYSALNYPSEVSAYRVRHQDYFGMVNAYEPHEHVYQVLRRKPGTVVLRGGGITASRVLQRLLADRAESGHDIRVLHLFRSYVDRAQGPWNFRRPGGDGWRYQPFSFPKGAGSGQLRQRLLRLDDAARADTIKSMAGTTSAKRGLWQKQLKQARAAGHYRQFHGDIRAMTPNGDGTVELRVDVDSLPPDTRLDADFVIDCTGLRLVLRHNPLLADLLATGGVRSNSLGGLAVGHHFDVLGSDHEGGQIYASGVIARGGYLAPVDSFWGFSHAALLICDDLARRGFCCRLGMTRSTVSWFKWLGGVRP